MNILSSCQAILFVRCYYALNLCIKEKIILKNISSVLENEKFIKLIVIMAVVEVTLKK